MKLFTYMSIFFALIVSVSALDFNSNDVFRTKKDPPFPISLDGYIYANYENEQVALGTDWCLHIYEPDIHYCSQTDVPIPGYSGYYDVVLNGAEIGNTGYTYAWNSTHEGQTNWTITSDHISADVYMVNEIINTPPVLDPVGDFEIIEENALVINLSASDAEQTDLTYSLQGNLPQDYSFETGTGVFMWTPSSWDSGVYDVTFYVTDGEYYDSESISISVYDNGVPLQLKPLGNVTGMENSWVNIYPEPSNPDWGQINVSIDSASFFWDPVLKALRMQTGYFSSGEYDFEITVSDSTGSDQEAVHVSIENNCHTFNKQFWTWNCDLASDLILQQDPLLEME